MWVRLRSSLPGAAIRSSTWKSSVCRPRHLPLLSPRIASIAQGERPPLIASEKEPRSAPRPPLRRRRSAARHAARRPADRREPRALCPLASTGRRGTHRCLLVVTAELLAHRGEHLVGEVVVSARGETLIQRRGQHRRRHPLIDRRDRGPAALAGIRDAAGEVREVG